MLSLQSIGSIIVNTESLYTDNQSFREKWLLKILISHKKLLILFRGIFRFITLFNAYFAKDHQFYAFLRKKGLVSVNKQ